MDFQGRIISKEEVIELIADDTVVYHKGNYITGKAIATAFMCGYRIKQYELPDKFFAYQTFDSNAPENKHDHDCDSCTHDGECFVTMLQCKGYNKRE